MGDIESLQDRVKNRHARRTEEALARRGDAAASRTNRVIDVSVDELKQELIDGICEVLVAQKQPPALVDRRELCRLLNVSIPVIVKLEGEGMPRLMLGSCVRYRLDDCLEFLRTREARP